jgi:hypothetical protein
VVKINSISASGVAQVTFNQAMIIPANFSSIDENILDVKVKPG